jgi:hypothetical protein
MIFRRIKPSANNSPSPWERTRGEGESFERECHAVHGEGESFERVTSLKIQPQFAKPRKIASGAATANLIYGPCFAIRFARTIPE